MAPPVPAAEPRADRDGISRDGHGLRRDLRQRVRRDRGRSERPCGRAVADRPVPGPTRSSSERREGVRRHDAGRQGASDRGREDAPFPGLQSRRRPRCRYDPRDGGGDRDDARRRPGRRQLLRARRNAERCPRDRRASLREGIRPTEEGRRRDSRRGPKLAPARDPRGGSEVPSDFDRPGQGAAHRHPALSGRRGRPNPEPPASRPEGPRAVDVLEHRAPRARARDVLVPPVGGPVRAGIRARPPAPARVRLEDHPAQPERVPPRRPEGTRRVLRERSSERIPLDERRPGGARHERHRPGGRRLLGANQHDARRRVRGRCLDPVGRRRSASSPRTGTSRSSSNASQDSFSER